MSVSCILVFPRPATIKRFTRRFRPAFFFVAVFCGITGSATAVDTPSSPPAKGRTLGFLHDLLPIAWQKRPQLRFNVITEMTEEGRKRRVPTPSQPMYFHAEPAKFVQTGELVSAGEKPPPGPELEAAMRKALAENGYLPIANDQQRPDVLILFTFGSSGSPTFEGTKNANEVLNEHIDAVLQRAPFARENLAALVRDAVGRGRLVAGEKFAVDLSTALHDAISFYNPEFPTPFESHMRSYPPEVIDHFIEMVFHTCYFVTATAFDFEGVARKQKIPLWQTRMAVEAQGVSMEEILRPLILNTGASIGREKDPSWVTKRHEREGRVDVGTPTVVEEVKPAVAPKEPDPR
jgi:hypothetical protein